MAKYNVFAIADYFLYKSQEDDQELLSNMKLQKLAYYAQGLHLALFNEALFDEPIEAWTYGPVVPALYHGYKRYDKYGIPPSPEFKPSAIDQQTREFLDDIYQVFGQFSAIRLMHLSHSDSCWKETEIGQEIPLAFMKQELRKYLSNEQA